MNYRTILVAVDGSRCSSLALRHAVQLARRHRSKLRILHVIDELGENIGDPNTLEDFWAALRKAGMRILEKASKEAAAGGVKADTKLVDIPQAGSLLRYVPDSIVREAAPARVDLLVIGTHGRRGWRRLLLGSVAESVLRASRVPVLLIRSNRP